jgi:hypothetical protein
MPAAKMNPMASAKLKPPPAGVEITVNRSALVSLHDNGSIESGATVQVPAFGYVDSARFQVIDTDETVAKIRSL